MILALIAATIISLVSLIGGFFLIRHQQIKEAQAFKLVGFAAGVMLAFSFLDLLPESLHSTSAAVVFNWVLIGITAFFLIERVLHQVHYKQHGRHNQTTSVMVLIGDGMHNFFDGIAIAAAFSINPITGWLATLAIAAHEIPQEIADFSVLIHSGLKPKKALFANFLSGLTAIVGVLVGFFAMHQVESIQPVVLSLTAGMFIYIALADLIPELEHQPNHRPIAQIIPFVIGLIVTGALIKITHTYIDAGHSHEHESDSSHYQDESHHPDRDHEFEVEHTDEINQMSELDHQEENEDDHLVIPEPHL